MRAIPTNYAGVQFRSRLEARWAAMFDLVGWRWEYEPIDLDGYIPDFVLRFKSPVLVEVKPILDWSSGDELSRAVDKIERSGWTDEAIVVGAAMPDYDGMQSIGRFAIEYWGPPAPEDRCKPKSASFFKCGGCGKFSICGYPDNWFGCRVSGCSDGDHHIDAQVDLTGIWREAGNLVQWRSPGVRR